jgi:hypothetical protein
MSNQTIDRIRVLMASGNPVPGTGEPGDPRIGDGGPAADTTLDWIMSQPHDGAEHAGRPRVAGRPPRLKLPSRRAVAPLGAGLAVAGLITGLTFAAQSPHIRRPGAGAPADVAPATPMPRFFVQLGVSLHGGGLFAAVRDSKTGNVLSQITVPGWWGTIPNIAADGSDRTFIVTTTIGGHPQITGGTVARNGRNGVTAVFRLQVAPDGRSEKLTRLPVNLLPAGSDDSVDGIAVAPGGGELAVALQVRDSYDSPSARGEIALYSLTGGPKRTWAAPSDGLSVSLDPAWISQSQLAFLWQDKLRGSETVFFTGRSQIRVLDTTAPGSNLLASRVLMSGGGRLGFIQTAGVGPGGSPITVATFRVTSLGGTGRARMLLAHVSPAGTVTKTFETYSRSYKGLQQEYLATSVCLVVATDATGQHTLAACPNFGRIDNGTFTSLAHNPSTYMAAW